MKPSPSCFLLGISRRSLLYKIYSIGESGDPCGIPVGMGIESVVKESWSTGDKIKCATRRQILRYVS